MNQKRRTRSAIVAAAAELVREGKTPTVAEVADAAAVSRATAYRYFPTQEYLLSEATLNSTREEMDQVVELARSAEAPEARVDALVQGIQDRTVRQEGGFRALLRLSLEQSFDGSAGSATAPRRGGSRLAWIQEGLAPVWERLDERTREHLIGALSLCMGIEPIVVLRDICEYSPGQAVEVCRWAAQAILRAGLDEAFGGDKVDAEKHTAS